MNCRKHKFVAAPIVYEGETGNAFQYNRNTTTLPYVFCELCSIAKEDLLSMKKDDKIKLLTNGK